MMSVQKRNIKKQNIIQLILILIIIILLNVVGNYFFTRLDLTAEKRYSLSDATKKQLKELDDIVFFRIYLDGDIPAGFKRLRNETKEILDEFRAYNRDIQYEFIDPNESPDKQQRDNLYKQLYSKGLQPTTIQENRGDIKSQQLVFPGAVVSYKSREIPLQLLKTRVGQSAEVQLNNSVQDIEYNLSSSIRKLTVKEKPKIAFLEGHGEKLGYETADIQFALSEFYSVESVLLNEQLNALTERKEIDSTRTLNRNKYSAIIIAKPDSIFSDKDKFIIDQFIMKGGKVLWLLDPVFASLDSLQFSNETFAISQSQNLEDMLFKYGVRLNTNLVQDISCVPIPVNTQPRGSQPRFDFFPWVYSPVLLPTIKHPIVNNLNAIKTEFLSTLDTIMVKGVKKTILLHTSKYSRVINTPARVSLDLLRIKPDPKNFGKSYLPVAVLLEGEFESVFKGRLLPEIANDPLMAFDDLSKHTKMIVIADGDIIKNQIQLSGDRPKPYPLGFDKYTGEQYGNRDFILNAVNYLCDDTGLIEVRSREFKLRLLDKTKVDNTKFKWQVVNTAGPVAFILLIGLVITFLRKKKYSSKN